MVTRPFPGERWWGGYTIGLAEGAGGWRYRLRRDLLPGDAYRNRNRWHTGGPFASEEAAYEAAKLQIIELERRRVPGGEGDALL